MIASAAYPRLQLLGGGRGEGVRGIVVASAKMLATPPNYNKLTQLLSQCPKMTSAKQGVFAGCNRLISFIPSFSINAFSLKGGSSKPPDFNIGGGVLVPVYSLKAKSL